MNLSSNHDKALFLLRISEADALEELERMDAEISAHADPEIRKLRFKVGMRKVELRGANSAGGGRVAENGAAKAKTGHTFAARYGVTETDGRPLYGYRLEDDAFALLQADLTRAVSPRGLPHGLEHGYWPGLFVLWAADWFRRSYKGGGHQWASLADALGASYSYHETAEVTRRGLSLWGRPLRKSEYRREFLGTLAREGGFPVAALGQGWARAYLTGIIGTLLVAGELNVARAEEIALARTNALPKLYQDNEFALLCADLAFAIAEIRRYADAPAGVAGLPVAAWLALHNPVWRETLPLAISGHDADRLLGDLLEVEPSHIVGSRVGAERLLVRQDDGIWTEAARLTLDGPIEGQALRGIDPDIGRLRVFSAGAAAQYCPGELALFEPPAAGSKEWMSRATARSRGAFHIPFSCALELELRSGERQIAKVLLPNGKPRRGRLLACEIIDRKEGRPIALKVLGNGSGMYRADEVVLRVPRGWKVVARNVSNIDADKGSKVELLEAGPGETELWLISGRATIIDDTDDCYRVETGQSGDRRRRLSVVGSRLPSIMTTPPELDLYCGAPVVQLDDRNIGSLFIRKLGQRVWRKAPSQLPVGHYDIGWRDGPLLLDKRRIGVLPASATIIRNGTANSTRYSFGDWGEVTITPESVAPVKLDEDGWCATRDARACFQFKAEITWPGDPAVTVQVGLLGEAALARWDGRNLPANSRISVSELKECVATYDGKMTMFGELRDPAERGDVATMRWNFSNEFPMSAASDDLLAQLLPASNDAEIKIGMLDGVESYWYIKPFAVRLERSGDGFIASQAIVSEEAQICARALRNPAKEVCFGSYSLSVESNHRPFELPDTLTGNWIVYLRDDTSILSRPELYLTGKVGPPAQTGLTKAMELSPQNGLYAELDVCLNQAGTAAQDSANDTIGELNRLVASLAGLPPTSFEVLARLPAHPQVLARMLVRASAKEREAVGALSLALPFAWCLIPKACWDSAFADEFARLSAAMSSLDNALQFVMESTARTITAIEQQQPLLAAVLKGTGSQKSIEEAAQLFMRRGGADRVEGDKHSRYRDRLANELPEIFARYPDHLLEVFDAPCAAALAAAAKWQPEAGDIRHIKLIERKFPTYFSDAFGAWLKEHL